MMSTNRKGPRLVAFPFGCLLLISATSSPGCKRFEPVAANSPKPAGSSLAAPQSAAPIAPTPPPAAKYSEEVKAQEKRDKEAIREIDFEELMTGILAKELGGEQRVEEACADSLRHEPVEIEKTVFGDLDGDGYEEAAVTAFSCQAGQAGPDLFAVFKQQVSGSIVELPLQKAQDVPKFKGTDLLNDLRGPWSIEIDNGQLIMRYLSWAKDAPKCGDADCTKDFVYRWDGQKLALTDILQSPVK